MEGPLDIVEVRVLGALIEKESATPDNYPLTLNALTTACNQTTGREPVMSLDHASELAQSHRPETPRDRALPQSREPRRVERRIPYRVLNLLVP
jgi:uncharacterized protein YceH (UPF0502 family)